MSPLLGAALLVAGLSCLLGAGLLLRGVGRGYRIGRLLWAAPEVTIAEAVSLAHQAARGYVRVTGRVSSAEEFPDENDRPLVFRRRRVQVRDSSGWQTVIDDREAVPFGVELRSDEIAVDTGALSDGLVVVPRESAGRAADLPADVSGELDGVDPATPARLVVEQVSAVEQATVAGRPLLRDGHAMLTAGDDRPLILTTLEPSAAMRVLASGRRGQVRVAALLLLAGAALLVSALLLLLAGPVLGATPAPTPVLIDPLDPRTGANASLVGAPLLAALLVVGAGLLAAVATLAYVRLSARN